MLSIVVVGFSNATLNEDLISLLREAGKKGQAIEVTIVGWSRGACKRVR